MSEGITRELTITEITEKNGFYVCETTSGQKYGTKIAEILNFKNRTATFEVASQKKGGYTNWYINDPLPEVPRASSGSSASEDKGYYFTQSYAKDIVVALIGSAMIQDTSTSNLANMVLDIQDKLMKGKQAATEEPPF